MRIITMCGRKDRKKSKNEKDEVLKCEELEEGRKEGLERGGRKG